MVRSAYLQRRAALIADQDDADASGAAADDAALNAAAQVGDDTLQKQARGYVVPDSFTHGTAAQRAKWFKAGFASGDIKSCNTFDASAL